MARVLITGSTTGLGLGAARELLDDGHEIVFHARSAARARELPDTADVVIGDLGEPDQVHDIAEQIARHGPLDAVIHNAGLDGTRTRDANALGQPLITAVNVYAPYVLTALMGPVPRLIYLSSSMHEDGGTELDDLDWTTRRWHGTQAYRDSKLQVTALAFAIAQRWPDVRSNAVDPGWVPTRMGGPSASDDLILGHRTQAWLAVSDDPEAEASGEYWFHQRVHPAAVAATDPDYQARLLDRLAQITGVALS